MLLSDSDLIACLDDGSLRLDPFDQALIQPSSIDVRLDKGFRVFDNHLYTHIDPMQEQPNLTRLVEVPPGAPFVLHPGQFVLASTLETIALGQQLAARLEGKSSLGRLGLKIHKTAGFIDPGFDGQVTLELSNENSLPIRLWPGMKIGQLCVFRLLSPSQRPYGDPEYGSRYQHQRGPTPSRYAGPEATGEDLYTTVARARAARWGYDRTLAADRLAAFVANLAGNADLRGDVDTVRRQLGAQA